MRILFVGSVKGTACALYYYTGFLKLGHAALPYDPHYFDPQSGLERGYQRLLKAPLPAKISRVHDELVSICRNNHFDLIFVMAENFLGKETLNAIRAGQANPPLFVYHSHDNNFSDGILKPSGFLETLAAYDYVFTTKSQNVARYQELGQKNAFFIPSAFEPMVHAPVSRKLSRVGKDFDVTFVGTFDHSRGAYFEAVGWERLNVWGSFWDRWNGYSSHRERVTPHPIYYFEFADVMSRSRLALGLLRDEADDLHTQRTFEIPACGALQIAPRNAEILSFFEEDSEIICFGSFEELGDKVTHYLKNDSERIRLAKAGLERVLKDGHRYEDRVREMTDISTGNAVRRWAVGG